MTRSSSLVETFNILETNARLKKRRGISVLDLQCVLEGKCNRVSVLQSHGRWQKVEEHAQHQQYNCSGLQLWNVHLWRKNQFELFRSNCKPQVQSALSFTNKPKKKSANESTWSKSINLNYIYSKITPTASRYEHWLVYPWF